MFITNYGTFEFYLSLVVDGGWWWVVGGGWWVVGGGGGVTGPFRTQNPRYENCSHFWENVRFLGVGKFRFWGSTNVGNISLKYVPIYRKNAESEYDIQNNN